jgi:hypothetical protein
MATMTQVVLVAAAAATTTTGGSTKRWFSTSESVRVGVMYEWLSPQMQLIFGKKNIGG